MLLFKNAKIITMDGSDIENGFIIVEEGKIAKTGNMDTLPATLQHIEAIDLGGNRVLPGFIDAHSHLGLSEDGVGAEGQDINEMSNPITPEIRALDAINPLDRTFREAVDMGVTTSVVSPGSANIIAGEIVAIKNSGDCVDDMRIEGFCAMKFALGENPKRIYGNSQNKAPKSRMASAALMRKALRDAKNYMDNAERVFNFELESLLPVLKKQAQAHFHAHRAYDIQTAIRVSEEFDLDYVIIHGTEGYMIEDYLARKNARVITGPIINTRSKPELQNSVLENSGRLMKKGLLVAVSSDHPEVPTQYLPISAALLINHGVTRIQALESITTAPAKILGLDHKIGRIKTGFDADLQVYDSDPLEINSKPTMVFINGHKVK